MTQLAELLVSQTMSSFDENVVPQTLQDSINKHRLHLLSLAAALVDGGHDEASVKRVIDGVFNSYKNELASTIMAMKENADAR